MGKLVCGQTLETGCKGCNETTHRTDWIPSCCPRCKHKVAFKAVRRKVIQSRTAVANAAAVMALLDHSDSKRQSRKSGGFLELYR